MPVLTAELQAPQPVARQSSRITALDWVKGALVLCMITYHAINYSTLRPLAFRFLGFLPPSFILIAGFVVAQVYAAKYDLNSAKPYTRLAIRGVKLLLLFTALNVGCRILAAQNVIDGLERFCDKASSIYLSGNTRAAIFEVLLPIAYFLFLAPVLLWFRFRIKGIIGLCAVACCAICLLLELHDHAIKNVELITAGIIGMAFGLMPMLSINRLARNWAAVVALYVLYRVCSFAFGEPYSLQMSGAVITLLLLYAIALRLGDSGWLNNQIVLLGQYSLLGYLVQIAVLQALVSFLHTRSGHLPQVVFQSLVTTVLTFSVAKTVHALRRRSEIINVSYVTVFG